MKKFICLFLMLWLPLFTGTALAMSTQTLIASQLQQSAQPCHMHDMAQHDERATHQQTQNKHCKNTCSSHAVCAFGCQGMSFISYSHIFNTSATATRLPAATGLVFSSQRYPPALKPPIAL